MCRAPSIGGASIADTSVGGRATRTGGGGECAWGPMWCELPSKMERPKKGCWRSYPKRSPSSLLKSPASLANRVWTIAISPLGTNPESE